MYKNKNNYIENIPHLTIMESSFHVIKKYHPSMFLLLTLTYLLFSSSFLFAAKNLEEISLRIGTASKSGAYYAFIQEAKVYAAENQLKLINVSTGGSAENTTLLKSQMLDAAIVQNDIAYHNYYNKSEPNRSFGTALPLFPEYFQIIVRKDSGIHHVEALMAKRIVLGAEGSGTYFNAKDVLKVAELVYKPIAAKSLGDALKKLENEEVDAICHTGASIPRQLQSPQSELTVISLPESLIEKLTRQYSYYHKGFMDRKSQGSVRTISLMAYLMFATSANPVAVEKFMLSLLDNWEKLASNEYYQQINVLELKHAIQRKPAPLHNIAKKVLADKKYILDPLLIIIYLVAFIIGTIVIHYISHLLTINYDRLGNLKTAKGLGRYKLTLVVQGFAVFFATLTVVALIYFGIMLIIQYYEGLYATENDIYNPFATISIPEAMLWLWGWIGGHEGNIFPQSTIGKILVVFPPMVGVFSIGWLAFNTWRGIATRRIAQQKGSFVLPMKEHVIICGWNEKARGIIFGLTTRYAPERKNVVVIAEMDDERPLEKYNFPKGCVYYYRGDSSDCKTLEGSYAANASAALILVGDKKKQANNIGSVLTSLAINKQNPNIFTVAELLHEENIKKFEACNIDALVYSETIIYRLAAQACFNPHAVSLFFDMLTHDEHSELYAIPVSKLIEGGVFKIVRKISNNQGVFQPLFESAKFLFKCGFPCFWQRPTWLYEVTPEELRNRLVHKGISLIAVCHNRKSTTNTGTLVQHVFSDGYYTNFASHTSDENLDINDILIYAALEKEDVYPAVRSKFSHKNMPQITSLPNPIGNKHPDCHILLIGNLKKCCGVIEQLQGRNNLHYRTITECTIEESSPYSENLCQVPDLLDFNVLDQHLNDKIDSVIILAESPDKREIHHDNDHGELDAKTLLIAQYISRNSIKDHKPQIIAEMIGRNTRELFKNAGVDVVLPSNLAVERMMIKMAYGYGLVSNYLMATLALGDNTHLDSIILEELDTTWLNLKYSELMLGMPEHLHLLAIYPKDNKIQKKLFNKLHDFGQHCIACPEQGDNLHYISKAGDTLLVLNAASKYI